MKVIVAKMPGGKAISVTLDEGATVKDAIAAANLEGSTDGGFEIRKNDNPAVLSDTVAHQDIIALTQKISGNAKNTVTLQFLKNNGDKAESIEVLKDFPLNPAKLFTDVEDDNERLVVEGYILGNSDKDEYNPDDYLFAVEKEDKPLAWKPLTNRNWIGAGCTILIRDAKCDPETATSEPEEKPAKKSKKKVKAPATAKAEPEKVDAPAEEKPKKSKKAKAEKVEVPTEENPKKSRKKAKVEPEKVDAPAEEPVAKEVVKEKPVKKSKSKAKTENKKETCKCKGDTNTPCECNESCKCEEPCAAEVPVKLSPSPELLSELAIKNTASIYADIMDEFTKFATYLKDKYESSGVKMQLSLYVCEPKEGSEYNISSFSVTV